MHLKAVYCPEYLIYTILFLSMFKGDIMGPVLTNLNNLVRMPTGCGEQNMIGFVPNIFVLKYLTSIGKVTKDIQDNAVKYMEIGMFTDI